MAAVELRVATAARVTAWTVASGQAYPASVVKQEQERRQCGAEGGEGLGKGDPQMRRRDRCHCRQAKVRPQPHPQPPQRQAHDRRQVLYLLGAEQAGHSGAEQETDDNVLGAADISEAISQPVEDQVGENVADSDDCKRRECGLHVL